MATKEDIEIETLSKSIKIYDNKHFHIYNQNPVEYLKFIIEKDKIKQQSVANFLQINKSTLSNILNYRKKLSLDLIRKIHKKLGISYDILMQDYDLK